jgi:ElaA protein
LIASNGSDGEDLRGDYILSWIVKKYNDLTIDELYNILKERVTVFVLEQKCLYPEMDGKDKLAYHLFKEKDGEIIAYLRILPKGTVFNEVALGRVLVHKEHRGSGIARDLIEKAIHVVYDELNEDRIRIQAQEYLLKFYASFGFAAISDTYLEDGIPHVDMILQRCTE